MNNDLRKAAESVLIDADYWSQAGWPLSGRQKNAAKLARHIQRLYDPTPVDEEWLRACGRIEPSDTKRPGVLVGKDSVAGRNFCWLAQCGYLAPCLCLDDWVLCVNPTRGQLVKFCEVFGIELREQP